MDSAHPSWGSAGLSGARGEELPLWPGCRVTSAVFRRGKSRSWSAWRTREPDTRREQSNRCLRREPDIIQRCRTVFLQERIVLIPHILWLSRCHFLQFLQRITKGWVTQFTLKYTSHLSPEVYNHADGFIYFYYFKRSVLWLLPPPQNSAGKWTFKASRAAFLAVSLQHYDLVQGQNPAGLMVSLHNGLFSLLLSGGAGAAWGAAQRG